MGARRGVVGAGARIEGGAGAGARIEGGAGAGARSEGGAGAAARSEGGAGARALNHGPATGRRRINWRPAMAGGGSGKGDTGCRRRPASRAPSRQGFGRPNQKEFG
jgi:hypothetical protein